jgi:hypothetical protein
MGETGVETRPGVFEAVPPAQIPRPITDRASSAGGPGDIVTLTDGRELTGRVTEETDSAVTIRLDSGSVVRLPRERVSNVTRGSN